MPVLFVVEQLVLTAVVPWWVLIVIILVAIVFMARVVATFVTMVLVGRDWRSSRMLTSLPAFLSLLPIPWDVV